MISKLDTLIGYQTNIINKLIMKQEFQVSHLKCCKTLKLLWDLFIAAQVLNFPFIDKIINFKPNANFSRQKQSLSR